MIGNEIKTLKQFLDELREPSPKTEAIILLVQMLNDQSFGLLSENFTLYSYIPFNLQTDGNSQVITFLGIDIWNSENDERKWIEEDNKYEGLDLYILRSFIEIINSFKLFDDFNINTEEWFNG